MIVMKFGGSSVKDAEMFGKVASIIKSKLDKKPVVVLSAVKGMTDELINSLDESLQNKFDSYDKIEKAHRKIIADLGLKEDLVDEELTRLKKDLEVNSNLKEKNEKIQDYISFFGERLSIKILSAYLNSIGIKSESFISGDIGLITDSNFGDAEILDSSFAKMKENVSKIDVLPVISGFGGKDENGKYTTFDRGGGDYVAALFGAALDAEEIQIWTDVNGIMSSDPRIVENAQTIPELDFDEASELAYFGARVLHPRTILPAIEKNIPVRVLNTYEPENEGSRIVKESTISNGPVKAISYKKGITIIDTKSTRMLNAYGYLSTIFEIFERYKKPVDMISTSEVNVSMTVDSKEDVDNIVEDLKEISTVDVLENKAIIYVVGAGKKHKPGTAAKIFNVLAENTIRISMISRCAEEVSTGIVVDEEQAENLVKLLHEELIK